MVYYYTCIVLTIIGFILWTALIDFQHFSLNQHFKDHIPRLGQRAYFFIVLMMYDNIMGLAGIFLFVAVFDQILNKMRKLPLFYIGSESKWDQFWSNMKLFYVLFKILMLTISIIFFTLKFIS